MARPAKSVKVKSGAIAAAEQNIREDVENQLRGTPETPEPPKNLNKKQCDIFCFIRDKLVEADITSGLDVFVLESTAIAIERIRKINQMVNKDISLLSDTALQSTRAKYQSDLWRGCNELCLSPQARAKIGSLMSQKAKQEDDPLKKVLSGDD